MPPLVLISNPPPPLRSAVDLGQTGAPTATYAVNTVPAGAIGPYQSAGNTLGFWDPEPRHAVRDV